MHVRAKIWALDGHSSMHVRAKIWSSTWWTQFHARAIEDMSTWWTQFHARASVNMRHHFGKYETPKYLRDIESVKTEKLKFELDKFLEPINDQRNMPNYVTASGTNSILNQLAHSSEGSRNLPKWWSPRLGHGAAIAASKPLQVSKYPSMECHEA